MKATTLILLVFVGLGLWFLYNYMNQKLKTSTTLTGPGLVGIDPNFTGDTGAKPVGTKPEVLAEAGRDIIAAPVSNIGPVPVLTARPGTMTFIA